MTTDLFARYAELDPVLDEMPDWDSVDVAVFAAIDRRTDLMTTQLEPTTPATRDRRQWTRAWIAAAAFVIVIVIGVLAILATTRGEEPVDIPAPPFSTALEAHDALGLAIELGTAEDIHSLLADEYTGYWVIGPTVAETDERLRFDRAMGTESEVLGCTESSPQSARCIVSLTLFDNRVLLGLDTTEIEVVVRIDDDGYISSSSSRWSEGVDPLFDLREPFWEWFDEQGLDVAPTDLVPAGDASRLLEISPEEAAQRYRALLERFVEERG